MKYIQHNFNGSVFYKTSDMNELLHNVTSNVLKNIKFENSQPIYTELTSPKLPEFSNDIPSIAELASILSLETTDFRECFLSGFSVLPKT